MKKIAILAALILSSASMLVSCKDNYVMESPDGQLKAKFTLIDGQPVYEVFKSGQPIVKPSMLGLFTDKADLSKDLKLTDVSSSSFDQTWSQPWGEVKNIRNNYNQWVYALTTNSHPGYNIEIHFRIFNDGIGFRYVVPEQDGLESYKILDEVTAFNMANDMDAWWIPAYGDGTDSEFEFTNSKLSQIGQQVHTPLTMSSGDSLFVSIHEAALVDYAGMMIGANSPELTCELVPWSTGEKVRVNGRLTSPWRSMQIAGTAGDLITSYLVLNLNDPTSYSDLSYIQPGKYNGIWWGMHLNTYTWNQGEKHGANTDTTLKYIDFAAKNNLSGVLVEGWNEGWDYDWALGKFVFDQPYPDFDIKKVTDYAKEKGVGLIGHHETGGNVENYEAQLERAYQFYQDHGVHAVKTGYVADKPSGEYHQSQFMVRHHQKVVEIAAQHKVMVDIHEPVKATGLRRTYPNLMTREGARGTEYEAWSSGNQPEHTLILPFTRCLAGPLDYTPGIFEINLAPKPDNRVHTTLAKQLALYVTIYSPLQMAADLPENYQGQPAFQFIKDVPTDWEETKVLHAKIGKYLTVVRKDRNSDDWYLGSQTDGQAVDLTAQLDFLLPGKQYLAEIYADGSDADWEDNPTSVAISSVVVSADQTLDLKLKPGGGQAIRFKML